MDSGHDRILHEVPPSVPSREAIAEFKIITNGLVSRVRAALRRCSPGSKPLRHESAFTARYTSSSAMTNSTLRTGTVIVSAAPRGVFHDNVFGATLGGPIVIPKVFNGRDKTFFFVNYEGTRRRTGNNTQLASVPTPLEKQGDFSQSVLDGGVPAQVFDPLTSRQEGNRVRRDPFPGNRVPRLVSTNYRRSTSDIIPIRIARRCLAQTTKATSSGPLRRRWTITDGPAVSIRTGARSTRRMAVSRTSIASPAASDG